MKNTLNRYKILKSYKGFFPQLIFAVALFSLSLFFNYYANNYTAHLTGSPVHDLILDHIPVIQVDDIFYEGGLMLAAFVGILALYKPHRAPFILKSLALFFAVRSFFLILTHIAAPFNAITLPTGNFLERLVSGSGDDLFFSGHTGFPFLMVLLFWKEKTLRYVFIFLTLLFGSAALFGHLHYSIDVFSALFITYGIFNIAKTFFPKDYKFFHETL